MKQVRFSSLGRMIAFSYLFATLSGTGLVYAKGHPHVAKNHPKGHCHKGRGGDGNGNGSRNGNNNANGKTCFALICFFSNGDLEFSSDGRDLGVDLDGFSAFANTDSYFRLMMEISQLPLDQQLRSVQNLKRFLVDVKLASSDSETIAGEAWVKLTRFVNTEKGFHIEGIAESGSLRIPFESDLE